MNLEEAEKIIQHHLDRLAEYFDTVVIAASWVSDKQTYYSIGSSGNKFAIKALSQELNKYYESFTIRKTDPDGELTDDTNDDEDDDGDQWKHAKAD